MRLFSLASHTLPTIHCCGQAFAHIGESNFQAHKGNVGCQNGYVVDKVRRTQHAHNLHDIFCSQHVGNWIHCQRETSSNWGWRAPARRPIGMAHARQIEQWPRKKPFEFAMTCHNMSTGLVACPFNTFFGGNGALCITVFF